jgi:tetratricopeptide (TPR) repeat protein
VTILNDDLRDFPAHTEAWRQLAGSSANLTFLLGLCVHDDPDEADRPLSRSIDILRKLRDDSPARTLFQKDLAKSLMIRGQICLARGSLTEAGEAFEEGLLVVESVVAKNPDVSAYLHSFSMLLSYVGEIRLEQGRTAIARKRLEKAITVEQDLLGRNGGMGQSGVNLIDCQSMLARLERESGRFDAARKALGRALPEMTKQLGASLDPSILGVELKALLEAALLDNHPGKDAAQRFGPLLEGLRKREGLLSKHPKDVNFRHQVVSGYIAVGQMFTDSGATGDGIKSFETAASILVPGLELSPRNLHLQALKIRLEVERGNLLDKSGKSAQALSAAQEAVALAETLAARDTSYLYDLACALALKSRLDPAAAGLPRAALTALREAVEAGFDNLYKLETDQHLLQIRSFDEFRKLIERVKDVKQANPPGNAARLDSSRKPAQLRTLASPSAAALARSQWLTLERAPQPANGSAGSARSMSSI